MVRYDLSVRDSDGSVVQVTQLHHLTQLCGPLVWKLCLRCYSCMKGFVWIPLFKDIYVVKI